MKPTGRSGAASRSACSPPAPPARCAERCSASLPPSAAPAAAAPAFGAAAAAFAVLMLPRAGWLLSVCALGAWLAWAGLPGVTVLLAAAALPTVLLLPSRGVLWSAPAGAPLLGVFGLGLAWPAFAGRAAGGLTRAALGALGLWWLVLAEAIAGPRLLLGEVPGTPAPHVWEGSAVHAASDVLGPLLSHGVPLIALVWAAASWVLPLIVRGRRFALDVVAVCAWAAALAAGTAAVVAALPWPGPAPSVRGLVIAAAVAGVGALLSAAATEQPI